MATVLPANPAAMQNMAPPRRQGACPDCAECSHCGVRSLAICSVLDDQGLSELERVVVSCKVRAGEMLVEEGQPRQKVFTLTSGMLRVYSDLSDGRRQIAGFLLPGDYVGLADEDTYCQTVEAVVPSTLCVFKVSDMERLMGAFPALKDRLHGMTRAALKQALESHVVLGRLAPVEKLASFLLTLRARLMAQGGTDEPLHLPMSRADIADYLGLTIETVSRSFTKLKTQALIRLPEPHLVEITDVRALAAVAGINTHHD